VDLAHLVHARVVTPARLRGWLRSPALHFAAAGALLFVLVGRGDGAKEAAEAPRAPIVVTAPQIGRLVESYERATRKRATPADVRALVDGAIDDEVLFREAQAAGLDQDDPGVQWRLIEKMTFLDDDHAPERGEMLAAATNLGLDRGDPVVRRLLIEKMRLALRHAGSTSPLRADQLEAWLAAHPERFSTPARVRLSHVYLSRERHPGSLAADAEALARDLRNGDVRAEDAVMRSDPFPTALLDVSATDRELAVRFGAPFAAAVAALPAGEWSEPVPSPFGLHVVIVHDRTAGRVPKLSEIEGAVRYGLEAELRADALAVRLRALRARYDVQVEWPNPVASAAAPERP
jgi:hypothetical protein